MDRALQCTKHFERSNAVYVLNLIDDMYTLPLAGTGSLCGAPNSTSVYSEYKFGISATHLNVSPPVVDGGEPWKCEVCSCNLRLVRVATKLSVVVINCCSAEYCCNERTNKNIELDIASERKEPRNTYK